MARRRDTGSDGTPEKDNLPAELDAFDVETFPDLKTAFLRAFEITGNVVQACEAVDIGRTTAYRWKSEDAAFAKAWEQASVIGVEALEDEARRRAMNGSDILLIFLLKGAKPHKYKERISQEVTQTTDRELTDTERAARIATLLERGRAQGAGQAPDAGGVAPAAGTADRGLQQPS